MAAYDVYQLRQAIGAIVYLDGLIAALDVRVAALEGAGMMAAPAAKTEEVSSGTSNADSDGVRDSAVNDVHGLDDGIGGQPLDPQRAGGE